MSKISYADPTTQIIVFNGNNQIGKILGAEKVGYWFKRIDGYNYGGNLKTIDEVKAAIERGDYA